MVDIYKFLFVSYSKSVQGQFALTRFSEKKTKNKKSDHKVINSGFHGNWSFPHNTASHERKWGFESILLPWWQSFGEFLVDSFSSFLWFVSFRWRNDFGGEKQTNKKNKRMQQSLKSSNSPHVLAVHTPLLASLLLAADSVSPVRWRGFLLFLGLWFKLLLVPLVVRLLLLLLLRLLLLLQLLLLLWMCCLGEGSLLLEWESCLQDQLRRLVVVEKTRALAARQCNDIRQWRKFFSLCSFSSVTESLKHFQV